MDTTLPPEKAALHRAATILGGQAAVAKLLGYADRRNVWPWFKENARQFPADFCPLIEEATAELGQIVRCEELRPDVAWEVVRSRPARRTRSKA